MKEFEEWYGGQRQLYSDGREYKLIEELKLYCEKDVLLLKEGMMVFAKTVEELFHLNPLKISVSLPSSMLQIFRRLFLKEGQLLICHNLGFVSGTKTSQLAESTIAWLEQRLGTEIQSSYRRKEAVIPPYR